MKNLFLSLALVTLLVSCKEQTKEKLDAAKDAVTEEMKNNIDSAKIKAAIELDSLKQKTKSKVDSLKVKSAEQMEETAKKLKESVKQ